MAKYSAMFQFYNPRLKNNPLKNGIPEEYDGELSIVELTGSNTGYIKFNKKGSKGKVYWDQDNSLSIEKSEKKSVATIKINKKGLKKWSDQVGSIKDIFSYDDVTGKGKISFPDLSYKAGSIKFKNKDFLTSFSNEVEVPPEAENLINDTQDFLDERNSLLTDPQFESFDDLVDLASDLIDLANTPLV